MVDGSDDAATVAKTFKLGPRPGVPRDVQASFLLWLAAVAMGVVETIVRVIDLLYGDSSLSMGTIIGLIFRLIVYAAVVYIIAQMRLGKNWARVALTILLGGIGTLSLVIDPISWLVEGNSPGELLAEADLLFILIAPIRVLHLAAVIAALVFMFRPTANNYFKRPSEVRDTSGG